MQVRSDEILSEIEIAAAPERVFQALIDPAQVVAWWRQGNLYCCTEFASDPRPSGNWHCVGVRPDGSTFEVKGQYLEFDPPRLLIHTWIASWTKAAKTAVRWEFEPIESGTRVRLRHTGLAAYPELAQGYQGWPRILGWIKALLETGETVATRKAS
jgi:uncharacterized protein YndB with AHSA1/START domain